MSTDQQEYLFLSLSFNDSPFCWQVNAVSVQVLYEILWQLDYSGFEGDVPELAIPGRESAPYNVLSSDRDWFKYIFFNSMSFTGQIGWHAE